jgi:peptidyl-prolyl cis-trans isomerase D
MLDTLRKATGSWVSKLLLLLLVVSFAVWGISGNLSGGFSGSHVVTAGDTTVSTKDYRLAYDRQISILEQQYGQRLTREQATAIGVDNQVLSQLVAGALLDEQARELGLGLSKDRLARLTREDPAFAGPGGGFDRQRFDYVLRQVGMSAEDYLTNRQQVAVRQQIVEAVSDGIKTPDAFLSAVALYRGEDRTVEYLALPKSLVEPIADPDAKALADWFEKNKARYAAPEYRKFSYVKLEPEDIADPSSITDEAVAKDYEDNKARYTTAETRTIEQLVFKDEAAAKAARSSIDGGSTFDDLIKAQGKSAADVTLGTFAKDNIPDKAIADAAFSLKENQVSDVIKGAFGPVIIRVTKVTPEVAQPLETVKEDIRKALAVAEASRVLLDVHDSYEDARAGGASMKEAADKLKIKLVTIDAIDRAAQRPDGSVVADLPQSADLLRAVFESETDVENPPINIGGSGFVFYEVNGITPARDRTLDEVHDKALADWRAEETQTRLLAKGKELEKRLKDGDTLEKIGAELSLETQTKRGLKRAADDADFGQAGVAAVFSVAPNAVGLTPSPAGDAQLLFKVTEAFEPASSGPDAVPDDQQRVFSSGLADDVLDELVAALQTAYGVSIDRNAIAQAMAF